jgi:hypothetical protein
LPRALAARSAAIIDRREAQMASGSRSLQQKSSRVLDDRSPADNGKLMAEWLTLRKDKPDQDATR